MKKLIYRNTFYQFQATVTLHPFIVTSSTTTFINIINFCKRLNIRKKNKNNFKLPLFIKKNE